MSYILIIIMSYGGNYGAVSMAEFSTKALCEVAASKVHNPRHSKVAICVRNK